MANTRFSEASFIACSTGNFKFQNVEKRDTEKSYVSEWVNSLFGKNIEEKKTHIHESLDIEEEDFEDIAEDSAEDTDKTEVKLAFLKEMDYDPDRINLDEVYICDGQENYHFSSKIGPVVLNNQMLEDWQQRHSGLKEALDSFDAEFYFDWDEMITEAQANGEISFGEFYYNDTRYFGYGYFN